MNKLVFQSTLTLLGLSFMISADSHPATERYIPIGYWASVSEGNTYMGEIKAHDAAARTMSVGISVGDKTITVTEQTRIWLDRSALKLSNLKGSYSDCREGREIEVKLKAGSETEADWIKVRITAP